MLDVLPTLGELAGGSIADVASPLDGSSLVALAQGEDDFGRGVVAEYAAEAALAPIVMVRAGPFKYIHSEADPPLLFNLGDDPLERRNLLAEPSYAQLLERFRAVIGDRWDLAAFNTDVLGSQARRRFGYEALRNGAYYPWDFQPLQKASERYVRNHLDLDALEAQARFPPAD